MAVIRKRETAHVTLRLPPDLKLLLIAEAHSAFRSINAEIVQRLRESFSAQQKGGV